MPAYLMGINIFKLRENLLIYLKSQEKNFLKESSIKLSTFLIQKKFNNLIFLNYAPKLEKFLYWAQQLVAESLGKKNLGFLPVISNTPKDHHSLLQLYLDGPKDKIFHIFSVDERYRKKINTKKFSNKINFLHKKDLAKIKISQKKALIKSFKRNSIPFREFKIKDYSEKSLAELFSYFILETIIIGRLIGINPFDQPAVEQVKLDTKKILN